MIELDLTKEWIIGFTEGEGCFLIKTNNSDPNQKICHFSITQADKDILEKIQQFFNFGHVYKNGNSSEVYHFTVCDYESIVKLIQFFDGNLRMGKKKVQFEGWKNVFSEWKNRFRYFTQADDKLGKELALKGYPSHEIAKILHKNPNSVQDRNREVWHIDMRRTYLERVRNRPPKIDKTTLYDLYWKQGLSLEKVGQKIGLSHSGTQVWIKKYQIPTRNRKWTEEELAKLKETYPRTSKEEIKNALQKRTWMAIRLKANSLGIMKEEK